MKYRLNKNGKIFDSLQDLEDSTIPKNPDNFTLVPDTTKSEYTELKEFTIKQDEYPESPMVDTIFNWVTAHKRYNIGNINFNDTDKLQDFIESHKNDIEWSKKHGLYHTVFMYDHSGIVLYLNDARFHDWDYGQLGLVFASPEDIKCSFDWNKITEKRILFLQDILKKEFKALKNYVENDTYMLYCIDENCVNECGTFNEMKEVFDKQYSDSGILVEKETEFSEV